VQLLSRFYLHSQFPTCLNLVSVMQMDSQSKNRLNSEERGDLLLNTTICSSVKMLLLFLTGNTLLIDGVSNSNEKFATFLLCLY